MIIYASDLLMPKDTRKSFRKIALSEHPDVNPDDPESQERTWYAERAVAIKPHNEPQKVEKGGQWCKNVIRMCKYQIIIWLQEVRSL